MVPKIDIEPRPQTLRFYSSLKTTSLTLKRPNSPTDTDITILEIFLARTPPKRITMTETLAHRDGLLITASEVMGSGDGGGVLRIRVSEFEFETMVSTTRKEYDRWMEEGEGKKLAKAVSFSQFRERERERRMPEFKIRRSTRRKGVDRDTRKETEAVSVLHDTNGWEFAAGELSSEGEGKIENDSWEVYEVGAEGWCRVEWDVGRWRERR